MKKITKRIGVIFSVCIISLFSFHVLAAADKVISTFEPGASGEVGFSSYTVLTSSSGSSGASYYVSGPSVQANDVVNSNNPSANCFKMVTADNARRDRALAFMYTNVTPTAAQKYLKLKVKRDYNGNPIRILINKTYSAWTDTPIYSGRPSSVWQDVVIDITSYANAGTAITNLLIEPVENNSVGLGYPVTVCIDDVVLSENNTSRTASLIPPTINVSTASFNNFGYTYGFTPSTIESYTVAGTGLIDNITVTPPAHYEISLSSGSGYQSTALTLTKDGSGNVATTTIYARLKAGNAAGAYTYPITHISLGATTQTVSAAGTVYPKCLTISGITVTASKTYSGTTAAAVSGTAGTITGSGATTATDGKWFTGDGPFTYSGTLTTGNTGIYNSKDVLTANYVAYGGLTLSSGTNSANYVLGAPATITPRSLTAIATPVVTSKVYDGTTAASITGTFTGLISGDVVTLTGTFDIKDVGTGKAVTVSKVTGGAQGSNYTYTPAAPTGLTGSITAKPLTIAGLTASDKVYDGTTTATFNGTAVYSGLIAGESFTVTGTPTATFADANVASLKAVTISGFTVPSSNYSITQPTAPAAITAKALSIATATIASKVYDGNNTSGTVTPGALSGFVTGEAVTVNTAVGTYPDANVGTGKTATIVYTLANGTGGLAANYSLASTTAAGDITAKTLTIASATASNKVYDGANSAVITGSLSGIVNTDDVTLNGTGTFASTAVADGIVVTSTSTLGGTKAGNYTLTQPTGLTANITPASGSPTGTNLANSGLTDNQLANTNLTISSGEFIINDTKTVRSITVAPGAKLTHSSGTLTATNGITLESDATGTATLMDSFTEPTITATVKQYVTAGRNWYMSAPINSTAAVSVLNAGVSVQDYDETNGVFEVSTGTLTRGKGYIQIASAGQGTTGTVSFNGTLNSGDVAVALTNTPGKGNGFNLVGNPYPSYLSWSVVAGNSINTNPTTGANMPTGTMWYRTIDANGKSAWTPNTVYALNDIVYNGTRFYKVTTGGTSAVSGGPSGNGTGIADNSVVWDYAGSMYVFATVSLDGTATPSTVSNLIPPMQAFWVKSNGGTLTFTNAMRTHETVSNRLKAPKSNASEMPLVRLKVTNGVSADEAVIYASNLASNALDAYDAPKRFNTVGSNQPEIYTQVGTEKLVINAMSELSKETEIPLGFATERGNDFAISASEFRNFGSDIQILLKDKQTKTEFNLNDGKSYSFSSDIVNNTDRFSILFRSPGSTTRLDNTEKLNAQVFVNAANQITIIAPVKSSFAIYNALGQLIENGILNSERETRNTKHAAGVYVVKVNNVSERVILK